MDDADQLCWKRENTSLITFIDDYISKPISCYKVLFVFHVKQKALLTNLPSSSRSARKNTCVMDKAVSNADDIISADMQEVLLSSLVPRPHPLAIRVEGMDNYLNLKSWIGFFNGVIVI